MFKVQLCIDLVRQLAFHKAKTRFAVRDPGPEHGALDPAVGHGEVEDRAVTFLRIVGTLQLQLQQTVPIAVFRELPPVVDLLGLHVVVVDDAVVGDAAYLVIHELTGDHLTVDGIQFGGRDAALMLGEIVTAPYPRQVGEIRDDRGLLAAEGEVNEILHLKQLQPGGSALKLRLFPVVKAVQTLGEAIQLIQIDAGSLHGFQHGIFPVHFFAPAIPLHRVADLQRLQKLDDLVVILLAYGERYGGDALFRVLGIR